MGNLIEHMENIAVACPDRNDCVISIILDGENAWEYYPENGYHFLNQLYRSLAEHPHLQLTTYEQFLAEKSPQPAHEEKLVAGSWVYGTFSTWIGDSEKNRGWEILVEAKRTFDEQLAGGHLTPEEIEAAERQLAICEGSDWFWWFGDYNPSATVGPIRSTVPHAFGQPVPDAERGGARLSYRGNFPRWRYPIRGRGHASP